MLLAGISGGIARRWWHELTASGELMASGDLLSLARYENEVSMMLARERRHGVYGRLAELE
jgi:hypothetical protein